MTCECCRLVDVQMKDYRQRDGMTSSYRVCFDCGHLNDETFHSIRQAPDEARRHYLLRQIIDEDHWEKYGILPPEDEEIMSWNIQLFWNNGKITTVGDLPDDLAQGIDEYLAKEAD